MEGGSWRGVRMQGTGDIYDEERRKTADAFRSSFMTTCRNGTARPTMLCGTRWLKAEALSQPAVLETDRLSVKSDSQPAWELDADRYSWVC